MPLLYQKRILRSHLKANPDVLFVFGDNVARQGYKGQAAAMRGEPNAVGVATKWRPSNTEDAFFRDADWDKIKPIMEHDLDPVLDALSRDKIVVWPADGIGTGLSQLSQRAPQIAQHLENAVMVMQKLGSHG